jgi:glycosyltransferase involved in cell wall biosynthesis
MTVGEGAAARVLLIHNRYQHAGGEDEVVAQEAAILEQHGHAVSRLTADNREIVDLSVRGRARLAAETIWSRRSQRAVRERIRTDRPGVAHFHNTFPQISPSAYYACRDAGVAVVQTLHNYRLLCPGALFFRAGQVCEECLGKTAPWPGVRHACYRDSRTASSVVATMVTAHRVSGTWTHAVDLYIALTNFAKEKFIAGGLPKDRIVVKPNFVEHDPGLGDHEGGYALFVGRLSKEKGLDTLIEAWRLLGDTPVLKIVGDGPLRSLADNAPPNIQWLGREPKARVFALMRDASALVFPSVVYEGFPLTIVEAFATGLPVIASRLGSMSEIVNDGETGILVAHGSSAELACSVDQLLANRSLARAIGRAGRDAYEARFTAERNYQMLMESYQLALERCRERCS